MPGAAVGVALGVFALGPRSKAISRFHQSVSEIDCHLARLVFLEPVLGDESGEISAVDTAGYVVPSGDRREGAGVVVEADGIVKAGCFGHPLSKGAQPLGAVEKPPCWS